MRVGLHVFTVRASAYRTTHKQRYHKLESYQMLAVDQTRSTPRPSPHHSHQMVGWVRSQPWGCLCAASVCRCDSILLFRGRRCESVLVLRPCDPSISYGEVM